MTNAQEALKAELISLRAKLKTEQQAIIDLTTQYDGLCILTCTEAVSSEEISVLRPQKEFLEAKVRGLELVISEKEAEKALLDKAIIAECQQLIEEAEKADKAAKFQRWRDLVAECSAAKKEMESTVAPLKEAQDAVDEQADVIQRARNELSNHQEAKPRPSDFATEQELRSWSTRLKALETAVADAFAEMRRLDEIRNGIVQQQIRARIQFEVLTFHVRMAWLPSFDQAFMAGAVQ